MIILDTALKKRELENKPVRVGLIGAGYMGKGLAYQIVNSIPGMMLAGISNRNMDGARSAYEFAGVHDVNKATSTPELENFVLRGIPVVVDNPFLLCEAANIDVIIEATGELEFGASVCLRAFSCEKHVILMNAELDATLGPILQVYANKAGVVISNADGDQPGVIMNLFRYVETIGFNPVLAGNMKGLQDAYRTPETQASFAAQYNQKPHMVTSFADGSKISMEMAVVSNATGFRVGKRGMYGPECSHVNETIDLYDKEELLKQGLVDYVLGAQPAGGVFVIGFCDNPKQKAYMNYYKMGDGPLYVFYTPYHLPHIEGALTAARAVLFSDFATRPIGASVCEVLASAKRDLNSGEKIDEIGGFMTYGLLENSDTFEKENLLPLGLAKGTTLKAGVLKDSPLKFSDVIFPPGRLIDKLYQEQVSHFMR
jgi:predicted homoserine dehydrogenase-like protein